MQLPFDQSTDLQAITCKVVARHRQIALLYGRAAVHPEMGRDVRRGVMLRGKFMTEEKGAKRVCDRLSCFLNEARMVARAHGGQDVDRGDARQPGKPDDESQRQVWVVCLSQNNQRQLSSKTMQSHNCDVSDEEYDEGAKGQEMQTPCALTSVKKFDVRWKTSGDGGGHRHPGGDAERCEQEYDCRVAQLL